MSAQKKILDLREKRDIGQVVNATFAFLRLSYFKMFRDIILFSSPFFAISGICIAGVQYDHPALFGFDTDYFYLPFYWVYIVSAIMGTVVCYSIVTNYVLQYVQNGTNQFDRSIILNRIWKHFFGLLTVSVFYTLANYGSLLFLIIPGIYFAIANVLARSVYVLENVDDGRWISIGGAFNESRRLITDNWWLTFALYFILAFLVGLMGYVFSVPELAVKFLINFSSRSEIMNDSYKLYYTISVAFTSVGRGLLLPISITAWCIYYYSLKESKDQTALLESIETIGEQATKESEYEGTY